jgi:hypothetical protein
MMPSDPYSEALSAIGTIFDDVEVDDQWTFEDPDGDFYTTEFEQLSLA